jgi:predicted glycoside hydrolase/deacetylase ChbG (UPF0249 family)
LGFFFWVLSILILPFSLKAQDSTYAEKLGFPRGSKVLILHVDDAGMSYDSNIGAIKALTEGISTSVSVMMPCPWVPGFIQFLKKNPGIDAGLHLTLTSEWDAYKWGPVSGKSQVPGLCDSNGYFWPDAENVVRHALPEEVEKEILAQLSKARSMGFEPTHLDSHMGTLFDSPGFLEKYMKIGMENHIPIMLPGGKDHLIQEETHAPESRVKQLQYLGSLLWKKGLPVLDDLHNISYDWPIPDSIKNKDRELRDFKTQKYLEAFKSLQPGLTMMIMHCTSPTEVFSHITTSGPTRKGDLLAMLNPELKAALKKQGIILTTWREVGRRRDLLKP